MIKAVLFLIITITAGLGFAQSDTARMTRLKTAPKQQPLSPKMSPEEKVLFKFKAQKNSEEKPELQKLLKLLRQQQEQNFEGGNVSGGGEDAEVIQAPTAEINAFKEFQLRQMGLDLLQAQGFHGDRTSVAVIDSGIDASSPAARNVVFFKDFTSSCQKGGFCDDSNHGTLVADLVLQAAPKTSLVVLKTLSTNKTGQFKHLRQALKWVLAHHKKMNIRVVNMSLTSPDRISGYWNEVDEARKLVVQLAKQGVIIVSAVGNEYQSNVKLFPASSSEVISVGSYAHNFSVNPLDRNVSLFSNIGYADNPQVKVTKTLISSSVERSFNAWTFKPEVFSPGEDIVACGKSCALTSGTSFAAALVSGGLASLLGKYPNLDRREFLSRLAHSCSLPMVQGKFDRSVACGIDFSEL